MARKLSKKKIYKSKGKRKTNKVNRRYKKTKRNHRRKQKGGDRQSRRLEASIRKVLREEAGDNSISSDKPSKKKGMLKRLIGSIPVIGNLVEDPEVEKAKELQEAQDKQQEQKMRQELENRKSESVKQKEAMATEIKSTINNMTSKKGKRPLTSLVGENTQAIKKRLVDKAVNKLYGVSSKVAETAQDIKQIATSRQCNAEFITNLDKIIDTCGPEELVKVYNEVAQKILSKKQLYSPKLEEQMNKLPILDFNPKAEIEPDLDLKGLAVSQNNKDLIERLQRNVDKKLQVNEKLKNLDTSSVPLLPTKNKNKKKKKNLISSKMSTENKNSSEA